MIAARAFGGYGADGGAVLSQWLVGVVSTVLAAVGLEKVLQALEVQRIDAYEDLVPFA